MTEATKKIALTHEEHNAIKVVRQMIKRNPAKATALIDGMAKDAAVNILLQAKKELADLLAVSRAMSNAAAEVVKLEKNDGA
jgi:predicted DNA-binding protein (UPF0251 family)